MRRVDKPEILDSHLCSLAESQAALRVLGRINRWFGGVSTTQRMMEYVAKESDCRRFSVLEVAAGLGEVPEIVRGKLARRGLQLDYTLLDLTASHLPRKKGSAPGLHGSARKPESNQSCGVVADALAMPFRDGAFDLVSCNLFTHHLKPETLIQFLREATRVCRRAVLINDLIRHPIHLALVYASFPIMLDRIAWLDGLTSVRRAYVPEEMKEMIGSALSPDILGHTQISRQYLFRMGAILWKSAGLADNQHFANVIASKEEFDGSKVAK